ncbi:hypothetical protein Egran_04214 [Elaphomyces granulatus]|uniref:Uncharacterized protein n=1 Tax=Elaphomyces granulatus TaxID=519963 RepID=A0A232LV50_9EURO|nr:hypothetical protein Egran_04214 [Elaphomyces granulatus]
MAAVDLLWHLHYDTPRVRFSELRQFTWTILHYLFHVLLILMSNGFKDLTLTIAGGYIAPNFVFTYHFVDDLFLFESIFLHWLESLGLVYKSDTACDY